LGRAQRCANENSKSTAMNRYGWTFVAFIAFCFLAPFYMLSGGPITADRLALLGATVAALGAFVNLLLAYGVGRCIVHKLRTNSEGAERRKRPRVRGARSSGVA
jgi:hypothetical protein